MPSKQGYKDNYSVTLNKQVILKHSYATFLYTNLKQIFVDYLLDAKDEILNYYFVEILNCIK